MLHHIGEEPARRCQHHPAVFETYLANLIATDAAGEGINLQRAHLMVMTHQPVHISGTAFRGLGRTNVSRPHTLPTMNATEMVSAGDNPIGRYAVHFHLVSDASRSAPPHVFTNNVIVDTPVGP